MSEVTGPRQGGTTGTSSSPAAVLGTWRIVLLVSTSTDVQRWQTTWTFGSNGSCRMERITESLVEGIPRTVVRTCKFVDRSSYLEVRYDDAPTQMQQLPYSFAAFDRNRLILEGVEYERLA